MDILFSIAMMIAVSNAMDKRGTWREISGLGDAIAWFIVSLFLLALIRIPIYLIVLGWHFPFQASPALQFTSGVFAIAFWFCVIRWQIGHVVCQIFRHNK
jgi:hypothetical protein